MKTTPILTAILCAFGLVPASWGTPVVWNGPTISFGKVGFSDPTQAANQDRITDNVWVTRGNTQGLFNAQAESFFTHSSSPLDTEWAYGTTATYSSLTYADWDTWANNSPSGGPPGTVGLNAVVHLITDDIYLDLSFTAWGGPGSGGSFSYERSTVPEPGSLVMIGVGALVLAARRRRH